MANNKSKKKKNNKPNNKVREVTQDLRNDEAAAGKMSDTASLSFDFDSKPETAPPSFDFDNMPEDATLSFDFDNKPESPAERKAAGSAAKTVTVRKSDMLVRTGPVRKAESAGKTVVVKRAVSSDAAEQPKQEKPEKKKQYGLPPDYSNDPKPKTAEVSRTAASGKQAAAGGVAKSIDAARKKLKKQFNKLQASSKEARYAAAERRRQRAIEEAAAKAEAERLAKLEAAIRAEEEEAARKAAEAKAAEEAKAAKAAKPAKKATKPSKTAKTTVSGKATDLKKKQASKKEADAKKSAAAKAGGGAKKNGASGSKSSGGKGSSKKSGGSGGGKKGGKKVKTRKPRKRWVRWLVAILEICIALSVVGVIAGGAYAAITISNAPTIHPDQIYNTLDVSTHIYDDKGRLTDDIFYSENREIAKYDELPDNLKNAFIAIEDKTFWTHKGFNVKRIFGAILDAVTGGGSISGTSTITQQLARNVFLPDEKSVRSIKRKIIEMYYAHEIEEVLSKEEILTAYLNTIYLGYGCYGVDTASKKYFDVGVQDLSLEQCAALAALPQAPGEYALLMTEKDDSETTTKIKKHLYANDYSRSRRYLVLDLMAEQGYITKEEAEEAKKPLEEFIKPGGASMSSSSSAFKDYLLETVKKDLMKQYDLTEDQATNMIYTKGLNIYSTLNVQAQKVVAKEFKNKENFPKAVDGESPVEAAMVIVEVGTGEIKAMAGTRHASGDQLFNRAVSPRQPGSSIKPIAVYAPALQKSYEYQKDGKLFKFKDTGYDKQGKNYWGNYITVSSGVTDESMKVNGRVWPKNFSRTYSGYKTFRQAIQQSINTCAVKILAQIGVEYSMDTVKKFGISTVVDDTSEAYNDVNLAALGLGAMTEGVTALDMALAYAAFPNGGVVNSGICYTQVTDSDGKVLLEGKSKETRVLNKGVAFIMTDVLQSVVSDGIAYDAAIPGEQVGGKTGTTDDTWDIWFDGFTAKYAAALWIGTDDNVPLNATSARAAQLWSKIMSQVKRAKGGTYKSKPDNVIIKNGEYFTTGTQPPDPPPEKKDSDKDKDKDKKDDGKKDDGKKDEGKEKKDDGKKD